MDAEKSSFPGVPAFTKDCFGYGVGQGGMLFLRKSDDSESGSKVEWITDGFARISEEIRRENGDAIFVIEGRGAKDGHTFRFEMDAIDFAEARKLKGKLTAQFGACNRVGGLTGDIIQQISLDIKKFRLIETPRWDDRNAAVPGLDLIPNVKYATNPRVPVKVGGGNLSNAQECLKDLLYSWDWTSTPIVLAAVLGSPIVERWYPSDRFGLALSATTGSGKTEFIKHIMAIYGAGYLNEDNLMRWGAGATTNALMKTAATSGFLPFLVDNYKPINKDDSANLIGFIQAVLEGSDKARLSSDSEFKDSLKFACTLLITGEDFPEEPSTIARCPILDWSPIMDSDRLTRAQSLALNLPALGKEWLTWLSKNEATIEDVLKDYESIRSDSYKEIIAQSDGINPGRLSTTLTLLSMIWKIALKCPILGELLKEFTSNFEKGIENLMAKSPADIATANEAENFVSSLNELIAAGRAILVQDGEATDGNNVIGWRRPDGDVCIFPKVARKQIDTLAPTSQKVTSATLYKQLDQRGYIKTEKKPDGTIERTLGRKLNGKTNRVLVFKRGVTA
jgi:hypothetical protein